MGRITKEVRPCKSCGDSCLIYDHNKWLCRDCARKRKQDRVRELSGRSDFNDLRDVFREIWNERPHYCQNCGKWLGNEPKAIFFSHIKSRGAHPELAYEKSNILLYCSECHHRWDFGDRTEMKGNKE